jgi:1-pyrroline-5-carboxylate dehydrogenase
MYLNLGKIGTNIHHYKTYPRIVGKLEEKISSLHIQALTKTSLGNCAWCIFQGQNVQQLLDLMYHKVYGLIKEQIITDVKSMKMGSPEDFSNFYCSYSRRFF